MKLRDLPLISLLKAGVTLRFKEGKFTYLGSRDEEKNAESILSRWVSRREH